jgi:hypothetical protein
MKWQEVALEFEEATLRAIGVIGHENNKSQIVACLRSSVAIAALNSLTKEGCNQAGFFLTDRGRLTPETPQFISAAVEHFSKEEEKWQARQARN